MVGGIQADKLNSLLIKSDDDGLLARFLPVWPDRVPIKRPQTAPNEEFIKRALSRLQSLKMVTDDKDVTRPWRIDFTEAARDQLDKFRIGASEWEAQTEGLLTSFVGKTPGMVIRLSLILSYLD